ncbi:hypothetical protein WR25_21826 [Diploscapter pachys]|uniref:Uncharacterized protein n=1 Tax=Diploscapter pachys TaxID=2018661 RepID=A0A2A2L7V8_9BILA|nr:hypothetical protein WR25_21826 [Diploscapter pachys]
MEPRPILKFHLVDSNVPIRNLATKELAISDEEFFKLEIEVNRIFTTKADAFRNLDRFLTYLLLDQAIINFISLVSIRDLVVFVSVHKPSDSNIAENEEFFRDNQKKIDEVICRATRIMLSEYPWSSGMERRLENTLLLLSNHPLQFHAAQVVFDKVELSSICRRFLVESF